MVRRSHRRTQYQYNNSNDYEPGAIIEAIGGAQLPLDGALGAGDAGRHSEKAQVLYQGQGTTRLESVWARKPLVFESHSVRSYLIAARPLLDSEALMFLQTALSGSGQSFLQVVAVHHWTEGHFGLEARE
jgi:hypothetical protein